MDTIDRAASLRQRLVDELVRTGYLRSSEWESVFRRVPRHRFVPAFQTESDSGERVQVSRQTDPDQWLELAYSNQVLAVFGGNETLPDSTSSKPGVMAAFLEALDVVDGNSVLEIGTGTGYNAGLLCERLGSKLVTSIDVNSELVRQARTRLAECGYRPTADVADGLAGYAQRAPYDRIIATCSVQRIPESWMRQLHRRGVIVTPLRGGRFAAGLVSLRKLDDGALQGRLQRVPASFIPLWGQPSSHGPPPPSSDELQVLVEQAQNGSSRACETRPAWFEDRSIAWRFFLQAEMPDLVWLWLPGPSGLRHAPAAFGWRDGSWMKILVDSGNQSSAVQGGSRRLWDLIDERWALFATLGKPSLDRYGITVTADMRQYLWLDNADSGPVWEL